MSARPIQPAAGLFPLMAQAELEALIADIAEHGQREPILLAPDGSVLDGRNRLAACEALGIQPHFERVAHAGSLVSLVVSLNLHRRHLSSSQRAAVAIEIERQMANEKRALRPDRERVGGARAPDDEARMAP
jgi:ParB-like chromosome segregation protein Spo0J